MVCGVTPHHLLMNKERLSSMKPEEAIMYKTNPPVRSEENMYGLRDAVVMGLVDWLETDHAPHTIEDKEEGARGFPGLETSLGLMLDSHNKGLLDINWAIPRMSEIPARIFNLEGKGKIYIEGSGEFNLFPGVIVRVPRNIKHRVYAEEDLLYFDIFAPPMF